MQRRLSTWALRAAFLGTIPLALTNHGCGSESEDTEGAYVVPAGFTPQYASAVARLGPNFARDERQRIVTSSVFGRHGRRLHEGKSVDAPSDSADDKLRLEAVFGDTYADGMIVAASSRPQATLRVVPVSAQKVPGRVRGDGAMVAFEQAFPNVTSAFGGRDSKVEEFLTIPTERDIPTLAYDLEPSPEFGHIEQENNTLWTYAKDGSGLFTIAPPVADDAAGKRVEGKWHLESRPDGSYRITADIDLKGLQFPVLLDPTFETPAWYKNTAGNQPSAGYGMAGAFSTGVNCSVMFGGATASFVLNNSVSVHCSDHNWASNITVSGTKPSARAFAAAAASGSDVYFFGGYTDAGVNNEFWKLSLSCSGGSSTCTGTWAQQTTPSVSARFLHGMATTSSGSILLFGGVDGSGNGLRDTWEFSGGSWAQKCASCFGGSNGLYGFASATIVNGSRTIYAVGGYDNPAGGGNYTNTVYQWTGSGWNNVGTTDAVIPVNANGSLITSASSPTAPAGRYSHWAAGTANGSLLVGSGYIDNTAAPFSTDAWQWFADPQWLRSPVPNTTTMPGPRDGAFAVYDENHKEIVLFGGLDSGNPQSAITNGVINRGDARTFTFNQSCTDNNADNACDSNQATLKVDFGDSTTPNCTSLQATFIGLDALTGFWSTSGTFGFGTVTASVSNGRCQATKTVTWDTSSIVDYGVRVRDRRYTTGTGSICQTNGTEITAGSPKPACLNTSFTAGSASCGGNIVDPLFGTLSVDCNDSY